MSQQENNFREKVSDWLDEPEFQDGKTYYKLLWASGVFMLIFCFLSLSTSAMSIKLAEHGGSKSYKESTNWVAGITLGFGLVAIFFYFFMLARTFKWKDALIKAMDNRLARDGYQTSSSPARQSQQRMNYVTPQQQSYYPSAPPMSLPQSYYPVQPSAPPMPQQQPITTTPQYPNSQQTMSFYGVPILREIPSSYPQSNLFL